MGNVCGGAGDTAPILPSIPGYTGPVSGTLTLNVHEGRLTRDVNAITTMDPYLKFNCRQQEFKTKVKENEGKNPKWEEIHEVDVKYIGDDIEFELYSQNSLSSDSLIGKFRIKVSALCVNKGVDDWWTVMHQDKACGMIHLSSHWKPDGVTEEKNETANTV